MIANVRARWHYWMAQIDTPLAQIIDTVDGMVDANTREVLHQRLQRATGRAHV